ncbi:MAG: YceD family protein [Acidimicrobiales bacterium]
MTARPFVVHVAKLRRNPGTRWHEVRSGPMADLACVGTSVPEGAEPRADVVLESVVGGVSVAGEVTAPWAGQCRRCLCPAVGALTVPVRELYTPEGDGEDAYPLVNDEVDLESLVRDAVLLELPLAPLCTEGCQGLCPVCGANRNETSCSCAAPRDERWAALDTLRVPDLGAEN